MRACQGLHTGTQTDDVIEQKYSHAKATHGKIHLWKIKDALQEFEKLRQMNE